MLITVLIIFYTLIACIIGCAIYVYTDCKDSDDMGIVGGIFWPFTIIFIVLYKLFTFICNNLCNFFEYLKNEGLHYCKEDIPSYCGQCKYMHYWNNNNELNGCYLHKGDTHFSSTSISCEKFKKHWLWRFRIRYKWDIK